VFLGITLQGVCSIPLVTLKTILGEKDVRIERVRIKEENKRKNV
jgi:hypothetical protein